MWKLNILGSFHLDGQRFTGRFGLLLGYMEQDKRSTRINRIQILQMCKFVVKINIYIDKL